MTYVATFSGALHTGKHLHGLRGLGDDDVFGDYNPLALPLDPGFTAPPYTLPPFVTGPITVEPQLQTTFGNEEYSSIDPSAYPGSGGSYPAVPNPSPSSSSSGLVSSILNAAGGISAAARPSPTVQVPLSMSSAGMWFSNSTLIAGIPNWMVAAGLLAGAGLLMSSGGKRRRR
jgi:hypothetical protein